MYRVTWAMSSDTGSPLAAARDAWETMREPDSTASRFVVTDTRTGKTWRVDPNQETVDYCCEEYPRGH